MVENFGVEKSGFEAFKFEESGVEEFLF